MSSVTAIDDGMISRIFPAVASTDRLGRSVASSCGTDRFGSVLLTSSSNDGDDDDDDARTSTVCH